MRTRLIAAAILWAPDHRTSFSAFIAQDAKHWARLVKDSGAKAD